MHKTVSELRDERLRARQSESLCTSLIDRIESDDHLELSDYFEKAALATLERLADVFDTRTKELDHAITNYDPDPRTERYGNLER